MIRPAAVTALAIVSALWAVLLAADFALTLFRVPAWEALFAPEVVSYFAALPAWALVLWGAVPAGTALGALGLAWREPWCVAMLFLAFIANLALTAWLELGAVPQMQSVTGDAGVWVMTAACGVSAVLYLLARWARVDGTVP